MNLNNLNLVELNAQEYKEIDGGYIPPIEQWGLWLGVATVVVLTLGVVGAYQAGYDAGVNAK